MRAMNMDQIQFRSAALLSMAAVILLIPVRGPLAKTPSLDQTESERRLQLEKNTLKLLDEVISSAWSLKLPENRSFVLSNAADVLWAFDVKRARILYWDALGILNSLSNSNSAATPANPSKEEKQKRIEQYAIAFMLRQKVLRQVARHDPQLALEMLRSSRQVPPPDFNERFYSLPDDNQIEQAIATESVLRDPTRDLQAAREVLDKGFSFELDNLLYELMQKAPEPTDSPGRN